MPIPLFLRRLSYHPLMRRLVRALHLQYVAKDWYSRCGRTDGGFLNVACGGISARFLTPSPQDLRTVEQVGLSEHALEILIRALLPGEIVYDIGSNRGLYTVFLAKVVGDGGQVIAFEPETRSYEQLQGNVKLNRLGNVRFFRKALGDWCGEGKLYLGEGVAALEVPGSRRLPPTGGGHEIVEVVQGDRLVDAEHLPIPQVVKIDVEGYEFAVIQGLRETLANPACRLVCCEIHPKLLPVHVKPKIVLSLLKSLGFTHIDLYPRASEYHAVAFKPSSSC